VSKFYYWGPLLFHTKISDEDINKILSICIREKTKDSRKVLAGHIKEEYYIDYMRLTDILKPYFNNYIEFFNNWYGLELKSIETTNSWVNFMKAGEFNPPHIHTECDFSCVIYLDIPKELIQENKEYIGTALEKGGPGAISFRGAISNVKYSIHRVDCFPEKGDFFIFPATLEHFVYPFKSNCERISVSANFKFTTSPSVLVNSNS
jgi:uncharacterized protein (TIGR02466 family)